MWLKKQLENEMSKFDQKKAALKSMCSQLVDSYKNREAIKNATEEMLYSTKEPLLAAARQVVKEFPSPSDETCRNLALAQKQVNRDFLEGCNLAEELDCGYYSCEISIDSNPYRALLEVGVTEKEMMESEQWDKIISKINTILFFKSSSFKF